MKRRVRMYLTVDVDWEGGIEAERFDVVAFMNRIVPYCRESIDGDYGKSFRIVVFTAQGKRVLSEGGQ